VTGCCHVTVAAIRQTKTGMPKRSRGAAGEKPGPRLSEIPLQAGFFSVEDARVARAPTLSMFDAVVIRSVDRRGCTIPTAPQGGTRGGGT